MGKRLKAFTLMELLVAMAISAVAVSIAGLAYNMLARQFHDYRKVNIAVTSAQALHTYMGTDLLYAAEVRKAGDGFTLYRKNRLVEYKFMDKAIVRVEAALADTFQLFPGNAVFLFKGEQVENDGLVDELYFEGSLPGEEEKFHYIKKYGSDVLINEMTIQEDGN